MFHLVDRRHSRVSMDLGSAALQETHRYDDYLDSSDVKSDRLVDLYSRLLAVYERVDNCFSSAYSLKGCESLTFDVEEYRRRSCQLLSHLPSFEEMQGMNKVAGLWSDLFQIELSLLCNPLLLDKNIAIANAMKHHYLTCDRGPLTLSQQLQSSRALTEIQADALDQLNMKNASMDRCILYVLNNLLCYNERLSKDCAEDRSYYNNLCNELYVIKESELMRRSMISTKERGSVIPYMKRLCQSFDTDKCTLHLATLFFDHYVEKVISRESNDTLPQHDEMLRIATATYLLACALREHWTDISSDSYLERASEMASGSFTAQDIMATQLNILQSMPNGFTSMYTATEYGVFYLSNIRGTYRPKHNSGTKCSGERISVGHTNSASGTPMSGEDYAMDYGLRRHRSVPTSCDMTTASGSPAESNGEFNRVSYDSVSNGSIGRQRTRSFDDDFMLSSIAEDDIYGSDVLCDYLLLEMAFRYLVDNGGFAFVYHCLIRWDDLYMSRNWNLFIPPSRIAAVLIFHFFVEFYGIDYRKDLLWCRRFCYRVFRMLYDCDVALWYQMFRENIRKWLGSVSQSSARLGEMSLLLDLSGQKFRAAEACLQTFCSRLLFDYTESGCAIDGLDTTPLRVVLTEAYQLLCRD
ncbi:Cyclin N-terminal domain family protein [Babesia bovis T2Bo]|uniref:Cyclin N-terminal domain-containing protein n=1 Tax=Babesia bovis TaxID=5865 RepID=A7AMH9_BABBO|nr:Cyclin N-terminal domain family protein [Babesia bovis T2Bo]EDO07763.1 Cyclin N-terminal domain family protein [Babesia bovis T2Bo]|eukprot:XP_001611331.1 hypothetical protein [Babesia bovis T2Bo]